MEATHFVILLHQGTKRFGELRRLLPNVTQGMPTNQLREMERTHHTPSVSRDSPKVEYFLNDQGRTLSSVLTDMCGWEFKHF